MINYINNKSVISTVFDNTKRLDDPITKFILYSHGLNNMLSLGYSHKNEGELEFTVDDIKKINSKAFLNPDTYFGSCNTGTKGKDSFAQNWVNKVGGITWAHYGRSDYTNINSGAGLLIKISRNKHGFSFYGSKSYPVPSENIDDYINGVKPHIGEFRRR